MNKIKKLGAGLLSCFVIALTSCVDTSELYPASQYYGGDFMNNWYSVFDARLKKASLENVKKSWNLENEEHGYFNGSRVEGEDPTPNSIAGWDQFYSWHKRDVGSLQWTYSGVIGSDIVSGDIINRGVGVDVDQSPLYDKVFSQAKKLARVNSSFSRGILSKLYNGQVRCDGWSSLSLLELDQTGYGAMFPMELEKASYFCFAARGGSNTEDSGIGRITTFNIHLNFYKAEGNEIAAYAINLHEVKLQSNYSSNATSLVGFYFSDLGLDPTGIIGMSLSFDLINDDNVRGVPTSADFTDHSEFHTALMLLEVLFPDSTWN